MYLSLRLPTLFVVFSASKYKYTYWYKSKKEKEIKDKQNITISREQINDIQKCILENLESIELYTDDYYKYILFGFKLYQAGYGWKII